MQLATQALTEGLGFSLMLLGPALLYAAWRLGLGLGEDIYRKRRQKNAKHR